MASKITIINLYCKDCNETIHGTTNNQEIVHSVDGNISYTKIKCPYCPRVYYIRNENGEPVEITAESTKMDILSDDDNPTFKEMNIKE